MHFLKPYRFYLQTPQKVTIFFSGGTAPTLPGGDQFTLGTLLMWMTGASQVPAEGYLQQPSIKVDHLNPERLPFVNTCSCELTLTVRREMRQLDTALPFLVGIVANSFFFSHA